MSLDKVAEVFDTVEVPDIEDGKEDEDLEALMDELYGEAENTKVFCKTMGGDEEDEEAPVEEQAEDHWDNEPTNYEHDDQRLGAHTTSSSQQRVDFLESLEMCAAGKHENFKGHDVPTWKDEIRKTAANAEALTGSTFSGSKKVEVNIQSASRFLAYGVMLASIITLAAKATVSTGSTQADAAADAVVMASASQIESSLDLPPFNATGEIGEDGDFMHEEDEEEQQRKREEAEEKRRNAIAEKMHQKHMAEIEKKEAAARHNEELIEKQHDEAEEAAHREQAKQEQADIKRLLDVAKSLEERQLEEHPDGAVDPEAAKIIEAAKHLAAKALQKQNEQVATAKDLDHQVEDHLALKNVVGVAQKEALNVIEETKVSGWVKPEHSNVLGGARWLAQNLEEVKDTVEETARQAKKEAENPLAFAAAEEAKQKEEKRQEQEMKKKIELAREKVAKARWKEEQKRNMSSVAPDLNPECGAWAKAGECLNNGVWMHENCAMSCAQMEKRDSDYRCASWAQKGECESNKIYMMHHCPTSCGMSAPAPAPPPADFARSKRAAKLKKKMKDAQVKDNSKAFIVRGKGLQKAAVEAQDAKPLMGHGLGAHAVHRPHENLLDRLSGIPESRF